jgi:hypothetical protein
MPTRKYESETSGGHSHPTPKPVTTTDEALKRGHFGTAADQPADIVFPGPKS